MQYQIATQAELATLSKQQLFDRCLELQTAFVESQTPIPGQPQYMVTPDGYTKWIETKVHLSDSDKSLVNVPKVGYTISAFGWNKINEVLRVSVFNNPNVEKIKDEKGQLKSVRVKGVAYGCIGGVPSVTSLSLEFNFYEMFKREITSLVMGYPAQAIMGTRTFIPTDTTKPWVFYPIQDEAGVWVDISHPEVIKKIQTLQQRRQWADRLAFAFLRRNLIKIFAGNIPTTSKYKNCDLTVKGWYYPISKDHMEKVVRAALEGKQEDEQIEFKTAEAEVIKSPDEAESVETEIIDEVTGEVTQSTNNVDCNRQEMSNEKQEEKAVENPEKQELLQKIQRGWSFLDSAQKQELKNEYPNQGSTYDVETLKKINKKINELVDSKQA